MSPLTSDQQDAADAFFKFLMSDDQIFVLSGGAGVGKTFLMNHICAKVMTYYEAACALIDEKPKYTQLAFTATTNKAAEVLEASVQKPVDTIHSFLGLKVTENYKTGKTNLTKTYNWRKRKGYIVFIDESSMIDGNLYRIILESFSESKIIFVGDHAQMAPVNEDMSPIYKDIDEDNFIFLGQPVRNAGQPALVKLCAQLRDTVETGVFQPIKAELDVIEYLDDTTMQEKLIEVFANNLQPSARILCYTNKRVDQYNAHIREIRGLPPYPVKGDRMVVAQTFIKGSLTLNVERELEVLSNKPTNLSEHDYGDITYDGEPIKLQVLRVKDALHGEYSLPIPVDSAHWKDAIKRAASRKDWPLYFHLKQLCADIRDTAACTVYKSQGSTYETVFIDIGNIGGSFDEKQVARMLFVAVSRASTKVYLFGRLPARYRGNQTLCPVSA